MPRLHMEHFNFNSQPHEEADDHVHRVLSVHTHISTHSLTKRLTGDYGGCYCKYYISTHSLTKRLTIVDRGSAFWDLFQLTASRRGWRSDGTLSPFSIIHFNSQPHEEADMMHEDKDDSGDVFQLTASRRGWLYPIRLPLPFGAFQLTASRRGWPDRDDRARYHRKISTHSLTKRLTSVQQKRMTIISFQLTASRRGWLPVELTLLLAVLFQLTASRRGWRV